MSFQPVCRLITLPLCMLASLETMAEETQLRFYTEESPITPFRKKAKPPALVRNWLKRA